MGPENVELIVERKAQLIRDGGLLEFFPAHALDRDGWFSGAEIEQAVIGASYRALDSRKKLDTELVLQELRDTVPLSSSQREDINRRREEARGRSVT